ncbi:MAG: LysR family transcriptional regulator [Syntrophales bacterium]|jgi:hypothetical protein|nr:LysR family transcriptional regulator [Syntrophales bacterium]
MNRGYVHLWRKVEDSAVFQSEGLLKVFLWCIIRATHKETFIQVKTGRGFSEVKLSPGTFLFGRESAAKKLHMSPSTVWKRILKLKKLDFLNIESNTHYSIIYIINWPIYQAATEERNSESDRQGTAKEHKQEQENVKNKKTFLSDSIEIRLSELLLEKILSRNPNHKKPNLQSWGKDIDLMIRIDNRAPDDIREVVSWCQDDPFWQNNILSTSKLRKQFDQLQAKMQATGIKGVTGIASRQTDPEAFECSRCGRRIVVKADLTDGGCVYCEFEHKGVIA